MRSTIDIEIDDELLERLQNLAEERKQTLDELILSLLEEALSPIEPEELPQPRFEVAARDFDAYPEVDFSSTSRLLDSLGEERYPG